MEAALDTRVDRAATNTARFLTRSWSRLFRITANTSWNSCGVDERTLDVTNWRWVACTRVRATISTTRTTILTFQLILRAFSGSLLSSVSSSLLSFGFKLDLRKFARWERCRVRVSADIASVFSATIDNLTCTSTRTVRNGDSTFNLETGIGKTGIDWATIH